MNLTDQDKKEIAILKEKDEKWQDVLRDPLVAEVVTGFADCENRLVERLVSASKDDFEPIQAEIFAIRRIRGAFERPFSSRLGLYGVSFSFFSPFGPANTDEDNE